jgi:hypothetical protein
MLSSSLTIRSLVFGAILAASASYAIASSPLLPPAKPPVGYLTASSPLLPPAKPPVGYLTAYSPLLPPAKPPVGYLMRGV